MKIIARTLIMTLCFMCLTALSQPNKPAPWNIDRNMRFQIGYLPGNTLAINTYKIKSAKPALSSQYKFDITNINLASILALGFDVPRTENPAAYNLFLKLYKFPRDLNKKKIVKNFFALYRLDLLPNYTTIKKYCSRTNNLVIKMGVIAKSTSSFTPHNPIPTLIYNSTPYFNNYLLNHIPFYSLYLTPANSPNSPASAQVTLHDRVVSSRAGVKAFYQELLKSYQDNLRTLKSDDKDNYYFLAHNDSRTNIIKLPKKIMEFNNWRELPMPQDPKRIFLTSLLLVYNTEYTMNKPTQTSVIPPVGSVEFNKLFTRNNTKVLEVGSVVYLRNRDISTKTR